MGRLIGLKTVLNEFVAYVELMRMQGSPPPSPGPPAPPGPRLRRLRPVPGLNHRLGPTQCPRRGWV